MSWTMISAIPKADIERKIKLYKEQKKQKTITEIMEEVNEDEWR